MVIAIYSNTQPQGTAGGASAALTFNARPINTKISDLNNLITLNAGDMIVPAGFFRVKAFSAANLVNGHALRIVNTLTAAVLIDGLNAYAQDPTGSPDTATLEGVLQFAVPTKISLQHYTTLAVGTGLGVALNLAGRDEVYATISFQL